MSPRWMWEWNMLPLKGEHTLFAISPQLAGSQLAYFLAVSSPETTHLGQTEPFHEGQKLRTETFHEEQKLSMKEVVQTGCSLCGSAITIQCILNLGFSRSWDNSKEIQAQCFFRKVMSCCQNWWQWRENQHPKCFPNTQSAFLGRFEKDTFLLS